MPQVPESVVPTRAVLLGLCASSPGQVGAALHLQQARLVQGTGVDVNAVAIVCSAVRQSLVVLQNTHTHTQPPVQVTHTHTHTHTAPSSGDTHSLYDTF